MDSRPAADRAFDAASRLKLGSWEAVESVAVLAATHPERPESRPLLAAAQDAATQLKAGTWESVRALAWLGRAAAAVG
ncbi:hypothetical protein [Cellulomonas alba]|uniref:Uncharacterized protein n=1 Tax=Cellulomonas alba TaxID=3053467 RepID=A0ABT7SEX3_9CELL|nr:hypothetical protein [Cellulomonas alba]MDM7854743.1 hypothetical protein [Cellulomonas alba]